MCVFSLKFLSQNYNTLKGETHRHEKAVPCPRGFLAISARAGGAVQHQQKAASLPSTLQGSLLEIRWLENYETICFKFKWVNLFLLKVKK